MAIGPSVGGFNRIMQSPVGRLFTRALDAVRGTERTDRTEMGRYRDGVEPSTILLMQQLDKMFGRTAIIDGFVPPPGAYRPFGFGGAQDPQGYAKVDGSTYGGGQVGRSIQAAMRSDPTFREQFEKALGGSIVTPAESGAMRVYDGPPLVGVSSQFSGTAHSPSAMNAQARANHVPGVSPQLGGLVGGLAAFEQKVMAMAQELSNKGTASNQAPATQSTNPMEIVEKQLLSTASMMSFSGGSGSGGGDDEDGGTDFFANGFSPSMGAKLGGQPPPPRNGIANAIAGAGAPAQPMSDTLKHEMLQKVMSDLRKMYEMISNIMKATHDLQKTAIDNIK